LCQQALEQSRKLADPGVSGQERRAYAIARICVLAETPPENGARVLALAEQAIKVENYAWNLHTLGLVHQPFQGVCHA
jgi:hypothetical protein